MFPGVTAEWKSRLVLLLPGINQVSPWGTAVVPMYTNQVWYSTQPAITLTPAKMQQNIRSRQALVRFAITQST
jgi:hypothetical protein